MLSSRRAQIASSDGRLLIGRVPRPGAPKPPEYRRAPGCEPSGFAFGRVVGPEPCQVTGTFEGGGKRRDDEQGHGKTCRPRACGPASVGRHPPGDGPRGRTEYAGDHEAEDRRGREYDEA